MERFYGYGIVNRNNKPLSYSYATAGEAKKSVTYHNDHFRSAAPFRVVELFYKDEQS